MIYKTTPKRCDIPKAVTLEEIFRQLDWSNKGLKIDGEYLEKPPEELQAQINELNTASNKVGLKMTLAKTKVLYNEVVDRKYILINNTALEIVEEYVYLGQLMYSSGSLLLEINRRIIKLVLMEYLWKKLSFFKCHVPSER